LKKSQIFGFLAWVVEGNGWLTGEPEYHAVRQSDKLVLEEYCCQLPNILEQG
jgi:hypothetical protein